MKILFILPSLFPNGPVRVMLSIAPELRKKGHDVKFWYLDDLPGSEKEDSERIDFLKPPDFNHFDVIHTAGIRPDLLIKFHSKKITQPTVTTMMNYVTEDLKFQYNKLASLVFTPLWRLAISKHTVVVSQQEAMKDYYWKLWGLKNQEVIPLCSLFEKKNTQREIVDRILSFKKKSKAIVSVSLVTERKGLDQIIQLLLLPGNEYLKWVHIGQGKEFDKLKQKVENYELNDRVLLLGQIVNSAAYMPLFDVYVMPSYSEGFGLALLEAVIQKIPAVTTDLEVFNVIFSRDEVPKFKPNSIESFNELIHLSKEEQGKYAEKAYARYQQDYTIQSVAQKYIELYNALIKNQWSPK